MTTVITHSLPLSTYYNNAHSQIFSSHLTTLQHYFVTLSVIFSCQTSAVIGLNPALYNDKVNQCTEVNVPMTHFLRFTNNTAFLWSCLTQSCIHKKTFISEVFI